MARAVQFIRSVPRWLLVRHLAARWPEVATGPLSCLQYAEAPPPPLPRPEWVRIRSRLSGICGSDLSTIACKGSPYFSPFVSTPFVMGHEVVGDIVQVGPESPPSLRPGMRVVVEPALGCEVRGIQPPCRPCASGQYANCENILKGCLQGGFQTGYCASTGGGWSQATLVAHPSQVHIVPEGVSDEEAVLAEPLACSLHAALKAPYEKDKTLLVIGCGTIGLLLIAAYRMTGGQGRVLAVARFPHQAEMARQLGADECTAIKPSREFYQWVLERAGSWATGGGIYQPELGKPVVLGGADAVLDCVGIGTTMDDALRLTRPGGLVLLVGMPGIPSGIDWTSAWYKELRVNGSYAYGWEILKGGKRVKTIQLALELLASAPGRLRPLVSRKFPLAEYRAAIAHAFHTEKPGNFKTVFDLRA